MLQLRPNCECCDRDLPPDSTEAMICSFECTFCRDCADAVLAGRCPNCGGELVRRPRSDAIETKPPPLRRSSATKFAYHDAHARAVRSLGRASDRRCESRYG